MAAAGEVLIRFDADGGGFVSGLGDNRAELARRLAALVRFFVENPSAIGCAMGACTEHGPGGLVLRPAPPQRRRMRLPGPGPA